MELSSCQLKARIKVRNESDGGRTIFRIKTNELRTIITIKLKNEDKDTNWSTFIMMPDSAIDPDDPDKRILKPGCVYDVYMAVLYYDDIKEGSFYINQNFKLWWEPIDGIITEIIR